MALSAISIGSIGAVRPPARGSENLNQQKAGSVNPSESADLPRYVGSSGGRPDVQKALYVGNGDRNIKRRWLREAVRENSLQRALALERMARQGQPAAASAAPVIGRLVERFAKSCEFYQAYLTGAALRPVPGGVALSPFEYSRRATAERLLRDFYGISNADLPSAISDLFSSMQQGGQGGDGQSGQGGGDNEGSAQPDLRIESDGQLPDIAVQAAAEQSAAEANAAGIAVVSPRNVSDRLRQYLLIEMARGDPNLPLDMQQAISKRQQAMYADESVLLEASEELATLALRETGGIPDDLRTKLPGTESAKDPLRKPTQGFNERFRAIVDHYPPNRVIEGIQMLTRSVQALGMARGFHLRGEALANCLRMMRDLSVISLIMEKTDALKHDLLLKNFAERFPREADIWQALCSLTESSRSISALTDVTAPCRFTPINELYFMQRIAGILRELPLAVWADPNGRIEVIGQLSQHCAALSNRS